MRNESIGLFFVYTLVHDFLVQLVKWGIGLLATYYMQLPPGMVMIFVSLPMYLIVFFFDRRLFYHSFHGMLISSFFIDVMSDLRQWNLLSTSSSAVTGGVMIGMGVGLMLAYETNTGGTDLLAQFFARRFNTVLNKKLFGGHLPSGLPR